MKNIVVLGGGTAGWISALYLKKRWPQYSIKVIDSSKIGILGAGEGATPNLKALLIDFLEIDETEFLSAVNGTKKFGIDFIGWCTDVEHSFIHGFGKDAKLSDNYSYHFNARLFADFLKLKAYQRGITHIDSEVEEFILSNNNIKSLKLLNKETVDIDFIIDCSGFHRKIIGGIYNSEWQSYSDQLVVNSAIPFFINDCKNDVNQKTIAKAEEWGWVWNIPLQDRWGCGYIYNDKMVDDETIISEINKKWKGQSIQINKKIKFDPGCYKDVWIGNCIAIGLAGGFLEPLEATSIMTVILQLENLPNDLFDFSYKPVYNSKINLINKQNMLFIRHHYHCNRNDTYFWKNYNTIELPNELKNIYQKIRNDDVYDDSILDIFKWNFYEKPNIIFAYSNYKLIEENNFIKIRKTLI